MDETLLSRIEDASLNASAPPQQRWMDGWLVRFSPGKAKRARCINAVAEGRMTLEQKLRLAAAVFDEAELPMVVRLTPFSRPAGLDDALAARGFTTMDDTRVMVCTELPASAPPLPDGCGWKALDPAAFAETVGVLRGSPPLQRQAHAERLGASPVRYHGFGITREADGAVLACGQFARESELVGLYDVFTDERARNQGLARVLCQRLLSLAASKGAMVGYLQVEADNTPARRAYTRLGFADGYTYHYRVAPGVRA